MRHTRIRVEEEDEFVLLKRFSDNLHFAPSDVPEFF